MSEPGPVGVRAPGEPWTILGLILWSAEYLTGKGVESGRLDAEHLIAEALGKQRLELYLQFDRPLGAEELATFKPLLLRRGRREPLQYIVGRTGFRELELKTDRRALIPRPETETLVEEVLVWAADRDGLGSAIDIGTGTGAIALSLVKEGSFARVVGTDSSAEALDLARENASAVGVDSALELRVGSLFDPLEPGERFDVVVSNPPYVADGDAPDLAPEITEWEPSGALFAGPDGLDVIRAIVMDAPDRLNEGGLLALEVGDGQANEVADLIRQRQSFDEPSVGKDLAGRPRVVMAVRG
ncbi:MAG: peptide chain release factor N(5)-glutamine methyltransferase [Gemmatimonadota bacterium]|nr:MAG: peptide chain release factor N(5)-glutamine methyltransferase [Gemmatimonadota bacterium]